MSEPRGRLSADRLILVASLIAVCVLAGLVLELTRVWSEVDAQADAMAVREYQIQQQLLARQAAERLGDLLLSAEHHIHALNIPDDPIAAPSGWLTPPDLGWISTVFFLHDSQGKVLQVSPEAPPEIAASLLAHAHLPHAEHNWSHAPADFCLECLQKGHMHTLSRPIPGHPGLFVAGGINPKELYSALFASLAGPHRAYVWVLSNSDTIISAPSSDLIGAQPFEALTGPPAATLGPILTSMKADAEGRSDYMWRDADDEALSQRLVAWSPVPGAPDLAVAYSADAELVVGKTRPLRTQTRRAIHSLFALVLVIFVALLLSASFRVIRERRARHRVEAAERRYRATIDCAADMLLEIDPSTGRILAQNRAATASLGPRIGERVEEIHCEGCGPVIHQIMVGISARPSEPQRLVLHATDGKRMPVTVRAVLINKPGGGAFIQWALRDISRIEEAHRKAIRMEKLSQIGLMTSSIAHEIKNPLTFVLVNVATTLTMMDDEDLDTDEIREMLTDAHIGAERIRAIAMALGTVGRKDGKPKRIDLRQPLKTSLMLGGPQIERHCAIEQDLPDPLTIDGVGGELTQVLLNLLVNAAQACDGYCEDGLITIRGQQRGGQVHLSIEDNGPGIPANVLANIFEPFFTTKDEGEGTGLGLSISREIIERHGGTMTVDSRPGRTVFLITLPAASNAMADSGWALSA